MTIQNKKTDLVCMACLKPGKSTVKDTYFDGNTLVVLITCECGGVSMYNYKIWGSRWVAGGERKSVYLKAYPAQGSEEV